jgi:hypothetical protein
MKHLDFFHVERKVTVELHWRVEEAQSPRLEELWWNSWPHRSPKVTPAEFLYLCLHGAKHRWARVSWLGDIAAIIDRQPDLWKACERECASLRLELVAAQTALLLQLLFGIEPDATATLLIQQQPDAHAMAGLALQAMKFVYPNHHPSVGDLLRQHGYGHRLESRYLLFDRFVYGLRFWLFRDAPLFHRHPALLVGMPISRLAYLFNKYLWKEN